MTEPLDALAAAVAAEAPLLADSLVEPHDAEAALGALTSAGDRTAASGDDYAMLIESVFEGYLVHYREPRLLALVDEDLRLLGGDFLYALGLTRLARLGDLFAVERLADLIALCARVEGDQQADSNLILALWASTALAIAAGDWSEHERLRDSVRAGGIPADPLTCPMQRAQTLGLTIELDRAVIAFRSAFEARSRTA